MAIDTDDWGEQYRSKWHRMGWEEKKRWDMTAYRMKEDPLYKRYSPEDEIPFFYLLGYYRPDKNIGPPIN